MVIGSIIGAIGLIVILIVVVKETGNIAVALGIVIIGVALLGGVFYILERAFDSVEKSFKDKGDDDED